MPAGPMDSTISTLSIAALQPDRLLVPLLCSPDLPKTAVWGSSPQQPFCLSTESLSNFPAHPSFPRWALEQAGCIDALIPLLISSWGRKSFVCFPSFLTGCGQPRSVHHVAEQSLNFKVITGAVFIAFRSLQLQSSGYMRGLQKTP